MRQRLFSMTLSTALLCGLAPVMLAQEPKTPYAAPREPNILIMLPDGLTVHAELADTEPEREYGLMERTSLPQGRGMLFIHDHAANHAYWMYHCRIGLDIVWMDADHRIVELSPDTPPCRGKASTCPSYGGHVASLYVLELPVGSIKAHELKVGQTVDFRAPSLP